MRTLDRLLLTTHGFSLVDINICHVGLKAEGKWLRLCFERGSYQIDPSRHVLCSGKHSDKCVSQHKEMIVHLTFGTNSVETIGKPHFLSWTWKHWLKGEGTCDSVRFPKPWAPSLWLENATSSILMHGERSFVNYLYWTVREVPCREH